MQLACNQTRDPSTSVVDPESCKELPQPLKKFYKGEPLALGITQLLIGIIEVVFGMMLHLSYEDIFRLTYFVLMTPYWTGMSFLVSGFLSVAAARKPNPSLVKSILGMNVVSAIAASLGIIFLSISLAYAPRYNRHLCSLPGSQCYKTSSIPFNIVFGIMGVFLVFNFLELCISLSSAAFGCKTLCRDTFTEKVVVVYQNAPPDNHAYLPVFHQDLSLDNAVSLPAASENAENFLSCSPSSPPNLPPLGPASEVQGLDKGILHQPEPIEQASSGDTEF